jgi:malonyl CoA-acyl carrier protein transacylase
MLTYMFPGQGSQFIGMGEDLLNDFKTLSHRASDILGYDIRDLCIKDTNNQLSNTRYTQPAIFVVSALSYLKHFESTSKKSNFLIGHSLGEYAALFAAGVFDFETGVKLVKKRGELMSQSKSGAMAAVIGTRYDIIQSILSDHNFDRIEVANFNSPIQTVLSGDSNQITQAADVFENAGIRYIPLPVSAAFHSSYMTEARDEFSIFLQQFSFNPCKIPVISNVTAKPYSPNQETKLLTEQITSSVRWTDSIAFLESQGEMEFIELGPGQVLTGLIAAIQAQSKTAVAA